MQRQIHTISCARTRIKKVGHFPGRMIDRLENNDATLGDAEVL